eukprot:TRINITY_DN78352_c0_g1_i1.p1 TRINITY_DN78352_c0_g1~~TRINITY_DN78352_c0_g1_i1.p1  ORF type:complete len:232 (+),score=36.56 TRINITY_DN78352_c0_g1_i1:20-715(+)
MAIGKPCAMLEQSAIPLDGLGYKLQVWWPLDDGTCERCVAKVAAVKPWRKRKYKLQFADCDPVWSSLDRKRLRFELLLDGWTPVKPVAPACASKRPHYVGSTDPGWVRDWMSQSLRKALPIRSVDTYYTCVGGFSGFDGVALLSKCGTIPRRLILYDRDEEALVYGQLMLALVRLCQSRAELMLAIFGRCPESWTMQGGSAGLVAGTCWTFCNWGWMRLPSQLLGEHYQGS